MVKRKIEKNRGEIPITEFFSYLYSGKIQHVSLYGDDMLLCVLFNSEYEFKCDFSMISLDRMIREIMNNGIFDFMRYDSSNPLYDPTKLIRKK